MQDESENQAPSPDTTNNYKAKTIPFPIYQPTLSALILHQEHNAVFLISVEIFVIHFQVRKSSKEGGKRHFRYGCPTSEVESNLASLTY